MRSVLVALAVLALCVSGAQATLLVEHSPSIWQPVADGPQDGWPDDAPDWRVGPPYQRDVYLDFLAADTLDVGYAGFMDDSLKSGDYWSYSPKGDITWWSTFDPAYPAPKVSPGPRSGVIGVDARGTLYGTTREGTVDLHLANVAEIDPGTTKNIWVELEWLTNADSAMAEVYLESWGPTPPSYSVEFEPYDKVTLGDGWYRGHKYWNITPNPGWEDFTINFYARSGYFAVLDNVHVLTECVPVPEPASVALLALAAGGIGTMVRKRRRRP